MLAPPGFPQKSYIHLIVIWSQLAVLKAHWVFDILFGPDKSENLAVLSHKGEAFWRCLVTSVQVIEGKMTPSRMGWDLLMSDLMRESFVVVILNNFLLLSRQSNGSFFATQWSIWDLSSPTRDWTRTPWAEMWSVNHWTTREVLNRGGFEARILFSVTLPIYKYEGKIKILYRFIEQSFRLCGRRRGWDVSREQHQNMYII